MARTYRLGRREDAVRRTRTAILSAARELLVSGTPKLSAGAVAARAGVSRITVYNQFGSKAGLLRELAGGVRRGVPPPPAALDDPRDELRQRILESCSMWSSDAALFRRLPALDVEMESPNEDRALADRTSREVDIVAMVEQLPSPENRVVPDYDRRDALGIPRPRITYSIDDYSKKALDHGRRIAKEIGAALKVTEMHHGETIEAAGHVIGTYRMGLDPRRSVVDPDQRAHDHPNLFLLGSGVFPTSAASNPTLTIAALALRSVSAIRRAAGN